MSTNLTAESTTQAINKKTNRQTPFIHGIWDVRLTGCDEIFAQDLNAMNIDRARRRFHAYTMYR